MRILILGASGLVGKALFKELTEEHEVYGTYNKQYEVLPKGKGFQLVSMASLRFNVKSY